MRDPESRTDRLVPEPPTLAKRVYDWSKIVFLAATFLSPLLKLFVRAELVETISLSLAIFVGILYVLFPYFKFGIRPYREVDNLLAQSMPLTKPERQRLATAITGLRAHSLVSAAVVLVSCALG